MKYIMLHGLGQSSESWSNTVKVFNDDFEVLCPNLSDWLSGKTPCYDTLYRTLETYCEQFEEPLNICGLSLGGILAMQYAIEHPEKMNSLVLIGTQYEMPKYLLKMQNLIFRIMPCSAFEKMGFQKTDFINLCKSMTELNFKHELKKISCSVLVVCGDKDKINKITTTKKYGRRYFTKTVFRPLDADDVDNNTKDMEESIGKGYIIAREVFGLNDKTRPYAERWIKWANKNPDKATGLI